EEDKVEKTKVRECCGVFGMKYLFHGLVMLLAAVAGLAIGHRFKLAERGISGAQRLLNGLSLREVLNPSDHPIPHAGLRTGKSALRDDSPLATKLEHDITISAGVTRWLHWFGALENATAADFPRLLGLAKGNTSAIRLVAERWTEVAPR